MERQNKPNQPAAPNNTQNSNPNQGQQRRRPQGHNNNQRRGPGQGQDGNQANQLRRHTGPRPPQHNNQRPPQNNQTPRPASTPSAKVIQKYENLLDQHLQMRKKYFEHFDRVGFDERRKLELRFFATLEQLRRYEDGLESWQKEYLHKKTEIYRPDNTYSTNHELPVVPEKVEVVGKFDDPHQLVAQKSRPSFKDDTEITEGTYEDYKKIKGIF